MNDIDELKEIIRKLHGVEAAHVETVPVKETLKARQFGKDTSKCLTLTIPRPRVSMRGRTIQTIRRVLDAM